MSNHFRRALTFSQPYSSRRADILLASRPMNRFLIQFTAVFVTALVVFGTDSDVLTAGPLGLFAGSVAALFISLTDLRLARTRS